MKNEVRTAIGASLILGIICGIYWFTSKEDTGTALLLFSFAAYGMLGAWLYLQVRRRKGIPRPEDKLDGDIHEGAGEPLGWFPAASIWPVGLALGAAFAAIALIWGNWYWTLALPLMLGSIIGWAVEAEAPDPIETIMETARESHGDTAAH